MWKKTALLASVLAVLSTGVYWYEFSIKPKQEDEAELKKMPFSLKEKPVSEITLVDGKKSFTFKCLDKDKGLCKVSDSSKWQIVAPETHTGDESNINALLGSITNLSTPETFSLKEETPETKARLLKEYGLDHESRKSDKIKKIIATLSSGEKQTVYLGQTHPISESFFSFSEKDDNTVFMIPSHFKSNFEHELSYWRNKKIFPIQTFEVSSFRLKNQKGEVVGEKKDKHWIINKEFTGDVENVDNFLAASINVQAKDFLGKNVIPKTSPLVEFAVKKEGAAPLTVKLFKIKRMNKISKKEEDRSILTLSGADPVYEIDGLQFERMNLGLKDFRFSKLITSTERFAVKQIKFIGKTLGHEGLTATQTDGKWSVFNVSTDKINSTISMILERLAGNRVQEFIPRIENPGAADISLELQIFEDAKLPPKRKLLIWKSKSKNALYARDLSSERKETFKLDNLLDDALPWKKESLTK